MKNFNIIIRIGGCNLDQDETQDEFETDSDESDSDPNVEENIFTSCAQTSVYT